VKQPISIDPLAFIILLFCGIVLYIFFRRRYRVHKRSADLRIPDTIGSEAIEIPLLESFCGIRGWGLFSIADNAFSPRLALHNEWMEYRVLAVRSANYGSIESLRLIRFFFVHITLFTFRDRGLTFAAQVADRQTLEKLAVFFGRKGVEIR